MMCCDFLNLFLYLAYFLTSVTQVCVSAHGLRSPATDFNRNTIVNPTVHHARTRREISTTRHSLQEGLHHPEVTMKVNIDGEEYILDLTLNEDLITDGHVISYQKNGKNVQHKMPKIEELDICQYSGSVRDKPHSWAAVSTCHGVRGVIYDGHKMRYIEPAESNDINSAHYIYDHSDLNTSYKCGNEGGVTNNTHYDKKHLDEQDMRNTRARRFKRKAGKDSEIQGPYKSNFASRYVELVMVADHDLYLNYGSVHAVHRLMKDIVNILNSLYSPLNIFIALMGVKIWTERDEISLEGNSEEILERFVEYRKTKLIHEIKNDNAHLIIHSSARFEKGVVGKSYVERMCINSFSGGVAVNHDKVVGILAATVAHEMGHNFGMQHDELVDCPENSCIMSPSISNVIPVKWSTRSVITTTLALHRGLDICLRNKPTRLFGSPTCGNGFVEASEECDCGILIDKTKRNACHACCDSDTCMLKQNATCATGECCDLTTCGLKSVGTECRAAHKQCDLPEYCTGESEFCPKDIYKMDSTPCGKHKEAYCVRGSCKSQADQCRLLWGPTGRHSPYECYKENNPDCGNDKFLSKYTTCSAEDLLCGRLQCQHFSRDGLQMKLIAEFTHFHVKNGKVELCHAVNIDVDDVDPGLVPDGAKCGENKMCLNQRCVSVDDVRARIAALPTSVCPSDCNGHGICNSEGHCHCEVGFAAPDCTLPGPGGSISSGPASDFSVYYYFMVAMYVIFLGLLPLFLLILLLIYFFRKKEICTKKLSTANTTTQHLSTSFFNMFPLIPSTSSSLRNVFTFKNNNSTNRMASANSSHCEIDNNTASVNFPKFHNQSRSPINKNVVTNRNVNTNLDTKINVVSASDLNKHKLKPRPPLKPKPLPKPGISSPKGGKPKLVIVNKGLSSTTNKMIAKDLKIVGTRDQNNYEIGDK